MNKFIALPALLGILLALNGCTSVTELPTQEVGQSIDLMKDSTYQKVCVEGESMKGPWENDLGMTWLDASGKTEGPSSTLVEAGGVPTVIEDAEGRWIAAFQWFACESAEGFDQVAVSISEDEGGTWSEP